MHRVLASLLLLVSAPAIADNPWGRVRDAHPGIPEVIGGYAMDDFARAKIAATNKELVEERSFVADMIA